MLVKNIASALSKREGIIVALDRRSGQLKSTPVAGVEEAAGVEDLLYTGLFYTGYPTPS